MSRESETESAMKLILELCIADNILAAHAAARLIVAVIIQSSSHVDTVIREADKVPRNLSWQPRHKIGRHAGRWTNTVSLLI